MSIDFNQASCSSSSDSGREGYEQPHTPQRPLGRISNSSLSGWQVEPWTFSTLPPEIINHIFGFWIGSVADVCTARRLSKAINAKLLSCKSSQYKIFLQPIRLILDAPNYHDSAMTIELIRKNGESHSFNLNEFEPNKRSFFNYIRICKIARDLIDQMYGSRRKLEALMKLQKLFPRQDTLATAKVLLSQAWGSSWTLPPYDLFSFPPPQLPPYDILTTVLATYPNQEMVENQQEVIKILFDHIKNGQIARLLQPEIMDMFINTITPKDLSDGIILGRNGWNRLPTSELIGQLTVEVIRSYQCKKKIDKALEFSICLLKKTRAISLHVETMLALIDGFLKIKEIKFAENLQSQIREPFAKTYAQMKIALAKKSLDELEAAKNFLFEALALHNQKGLSFKGNIIFPRLVMKIMQAFLMLEGLDNAKVFRDQLQSQEPYLQFQAQLEILKACPSREEFGFAMDLAKSMNEKKDVLLVLLITEYLKTEGREKLSKAIEVLNEIKDPYYKIKAQIQVIKAIESEEDYSTAKIKMNELFMDLLKQRADRKYWIRIQEYREEFIHFQEIKNMANKKAYNQQLREELRAGRRDDLMQGLQDGLMQELQEELMNAYIQKENFEYAIEIASIMTIDILQYRDNCILNLIDVLLKSGHLSEANLLYQLEGSKLFKALVQIKIAKASLDDKWEGELSRAKVLIDDIPKVESETSDLCWLLNKESIYVSEGFKDNLKIPKSVDGYVYAIWNLIGVCIYRKALEEAMVLLSKIAPVIDPELPILLCSFGAEPIPCPRIPIPMSLLPPPPRPIPMPFPGNPDSGPMPLPSPFDISRPTVEPDESDDEEETHRFEEQVRLQPPPSLPLPAEGPEMMAFKNKLLNKFLKSKDFQSAETLIGLIPNPTHKFEALICLIETMFKPGAYPF